MTVLIHIMGPTGSGKTTLEINKKEISLYIS